MSEKVDDLISRARVLMSEDKHADAKDVLLEALAEDNRNIDVYMYLGNACMTLEQSDEAIGYFQKALLLDANNATALYSLGCAHFVRDEYLDALKYLNKAEKAGFATVEMYGVMAAIFADSQDESQAVRCMNRAIQLEPLNPLPRVDKANLYLAAGKPKEALGCLEELQELLPDAGEAYDLQVEIYLELKDYAGALRVADEAVERFSDDLGMALMRARVLSTSGDYAGAIEAIEKIEAALDGPENPGFGDIMMQKGIAYAGKGDIEESLACLERGIEQGQNNQDCLYITINECVALKDNEKVVRYADMALALEDANPRLRACAMFARANAINVTDPDSGKKEFREIVRPLRKMTISHPELVDIYTYRVLAHTELGEFDEALSLAEYIAKLDTKSPVGYAFMYGVYKAKGDTEEMKKMEQKVKSIDPNFEL